MEGFSGDLKRLTGLTSGTSKEYCILRYHHPDGGGRIEFIKDGLTLEEAQAHCQDPATSNKTGPTTEWWFDGYTKSDSKTKHFKLWRPS